jgi:catechol 2,3-dioxygenase-like lactoylglutathione lyase family enzyme
MATVGASPVVEVVGLDHIVLVTPDVERALAWYTGLLGLEGDRVDEWRRGEAPFPSVRLTPTTIIDLFAGERTGVNLDHVCLVVAPGGVAAVRESGAFEIHSDDPDFRPYGAQGYGRSIYVRDPDGTVVEIREY